MSVMSRNAEEVKDALESAARQFKRSFGTRQRDTATEVRGKSKTIRDLESKLVGKSNKRNPNPGGPKPGKNDSNAKKGEYGESQTSAFMEQHGYRDVANHGNTNANGIDHIFINDSGHVVIVESKYGSSRLGDTNDGRQMSQPWLQGTPGTSPNSRLETALEGTGISLADVENALDNGQISTLLSKIDRNGNVTLSSLGLDGRRD